MIVIVLYLKIIGIVIGLLILGLIILSILIFIDKKGEENEQEEN